MTRRVRPWDRPCRRLAPSLLLLACLAPSPAAAQGGPAARRAAAPTVEEARVFIEAAEKRLADLAERASRAGWVQETYITDDTEKLAAEAGEAVIAAATAYVLEARRFDGLRLPADLARKFELLRLSLDLPAPEDPAERTEMTEILASLQSQYGKGRYCPGSGSTPPPGRQGGAGGEGCLDINAITETMAESRDPRRLLEVWRGWHAVAPPMREPYRRFVELANKGARGVGHADLGALWRAGYDMPPEAFVAEIERLWKQVEPLYLSLHAYVRGKLSRTYGPDVVPPTGPIPAHLLGNLWAQDWSNIYALAAVPAADPGFDLTAILKTRRVDARGMVRYGEAFFTSLGFEPLPETFWERSLFTKPPDRDVVCHASAWNIDADQDLRIKMCILINGEDFATIHHELGHNVYQRAYRGQPPLFRAGANGAFHEAIGDTIALSITPAYLKRIGLLDRDPAPGSDLGLLMKMALDKVAFLPFGLLVDQWRWKVFSGEVTPAHYNAAWWDLRLKYQGVAPGLPRGETDFDPGAKYHIPANVSYTRYFLAHILQFQFHRALCRAAGFEGPLQQCSIYGNEAAGRRLRAMLEMGASRPWPEALHALTGERRMDATAILDYFAPLKAYLDEQNRASSRGRSGSAR
jgi:peptidyl-dipeptidase A